jgi:hypothetical protein
VSDQLIVAGFHRSGTSLVCQLLRRVGLFLGYELFGANFSNPYGHFEDVEVLKLHEQLLADNGRTWQVSAPFLPVVAGRHWREMRRILDQRNADHDLWGFKDPRVCSFLMLWKHLLPNAKVLLVYRHFSDSTYSLGQRHSTLLFRNEGSRHQHRRFWEEPDLALRMWLIHNEALLRFARAYPGDTLAVSWEMVRSGFPIAGAINERWGLGLDEAPEVFDPAVAGARPGKQPVSDRCLIPRVLATWQALERLGEQTERMMKEATVADG